MRVDPNLVMLIPGGIIACGVGYYQYAKLTNTKKYAEQVTGIVFDTETSGDQDFDTQLIIRFLTTDKVWVTKKYAQCYKSNFHSKGDEMRIRYDPEDPEDFIIVSDGSKTVSIIFIVTGFVFVLIGLFVLLTKE